MISENLLEEVIRLSEKLITILTSVYNKAPYLETWAFSVAAQTYLDKARVIVIDDGSTDDSLALVKKLAVKYNIPMELYVHEKNMGLLRTLVESYCMIETKYFTILDADDYWLSPMKLEKALNFLETHDDFSMYANNYLCASDDGRIIPGISFDYWPSQELSSLGRMPLLQASTAIFRNFFTPDFLKLTVDAVKKYPCAVSGSDSFRDVFALKFGKYCFDNSFESVHRSTIGVFGGLTKLEKSILLETEYVELFELYSENFGIDKNSIRMLYDAIEYHKKNMQAITNLTQDTSKFNNYKVSNYTKECLGHYAPGSDDALEIFFNTLISHAKRFKELDL